MAAPFTVTSVSNYNSNPPSDDGAQTASNRVQWSTQKQKLADPIKTAFDTSETNTSTAFGKVVGGAGITTTAVSYGVSASDQGKIVNATVAGITITTPDATSVGSPFVFSVVNTSSGDITIDGNGSQTVDGALSFTIPSGCGCMLNTDGSNWNTDGQNFNSSQGTPQGRLTLTTGTPVLSSDVTAATSVYYTPYVGDRFPISTNGTTFRSRQISELTLSLVSNHLASTIYDVFLFDNSGTVTIGTGPAWNNSAAGAGSRGSGAGTTELQRVHGLWTNKNSMTARNGSTTYSVAANQGTYVGSIFIDGAAGQVSCHVSYGQSRKWGVWNYYGRVPVTVKAGDGTGSWNYATNTIRAANNSSANSITIFSGLAEDPYDLAIQSTITTSTLTNNNSFGGRAGIGFNSTTAFSGYAAEHFISQSTGGTINSMFLSPSGSYQAAPNIGINVVTALETGLGATGTNTWQGTEAWMLLTAKWRA
jgi:hypothetical protein